MIRVGSLFSGIGGIELGLERAGGFQTEWFVEKELYCQEVLKKHWPKAVIYDDITRMDWGKVGKVDMLTGGFPCQDISNAGKRAGIKGERSGLWSEFSKAISVLRPELVLIENVAALLARGADKVLCDLAQVGYDAEWHCVPASSVGAPHRRDRVFILAYPNSGRRRRKEGDGKSDLRGIGEEGQEHKSFETSKRQGKKDDSDTFGFRLERARDKGSMGEKSEEVGKERSQSSSSVEELGIAEPEKMADTDSSGHVHWKLEEQSAEGREYA
jgi:DNA (cytosine-5)-methyltransferase 1